MIHELHLSESEFRLLRDLVNKRYGILLEEGKREMLAMKLSPRVLALGLASFNEYYRHLKYDPGGEDEGRAMIDLLTNNETYFFRDQPQLNAFSEHILPMLHQEKTRGQRELRILSAGCSTGEEVYTLAILLLRAGLFMVRWDLSVIGLDVSTRALEIARAGRYFTRSFRAVDAESLGNFFKEEESAHVPRAPVSKITRFVHGNILDLGAWSGLTNLDVIFCRNVLIYFSQDKIEDALRIFHSALRKGGILVLGHSQTIRGMNDDFRPLSFPGGVFFQK